MVFKFGLRPIGIVLGRIIQDGELPLGRDFTRYSSGVDCAFSYFVFGAVSCGGEC